MLLRPGSAARLAATIREKVDDLGEEGGQDIWDAKDSGITCDDLSDAAVLLVDDIWQLPEVHDAEALGLAWDLTLDLAKITVRGVSENPKASGDRDRPSDELLDELLCDILKRYEERDGLDRQIVEDTIQRLEKEAKDVGGYGIEPWFPNILAKLHGIDMETGLEKDSKTGSDSDTS
jgi:hypothetical protein